MLTKKSPHLYIIAGPNGSGKTTFVRRFLPYYADCINFVNADLIAAGLSPFLPDIAAIKAGKILLDQIHEHIKADHGLMNSSKVQESLPLDGGGLGWGW